MELLFDKQTFRSWRSHSIHQIWHSCSARSKIKGRGWSRTAATSKMKPFVIIVNGYKLVNYYHKALRLGCCSSPRSASVDSSNFIFSSQEYWGILRRLLRNQILKWKISKVSKKVFKSENQTCTFLWILF